MPRAKKVDVVAIIKKRGSRERRMQFMREAVEAGFKRSEAKLFLKYFVLKDD